MSILLEQHAVDKYGTKAIDYALGTNVKSDCLTNKKGNPISMKKVITSLPEVDEMIWDGEKYVGVKTKAYWFIRSDEPLVLRLYGEPMGDGKTFTGCSYYGDESWCVEHGDNGLGFSNIRLAIADWAKDNGWFFEWDDAGSCSLYDG